jgi:predicted house-cleaning noncanonical NTP pyrophosphatase (MazG superfamily)
VSRQVFTIGIKGLIRNSKGEFLVLGVPERKLRNKKFKPWDVPGGQIEPGETFQATLAREIKEELSIVYDAKPEFITSTFTDIRIPNEMGEVALVLMFYLLTIPDNSKIILSDDHNSYEWVELDEAINRLEDKYQDDFAEQIRKNLTARRSKKLVRDKIPDIIRADGKEPITRILDDQEEYLTELVNKLAEELKEFSLDYSLEELADIQEVVQAMRDGIGKTH